jgi:hypothetical protein
MSAYASIRQHTPAYVSIRQHTSAYLWSGSVVRRSRSHWSKLMDPSRTGGAGTPPPSSPVSSRAPAYASIRQHTSAYVSIRQRLAQARPPPPPPRRLERLQLRRACQYLYFCTRKCASICTFVLVNEGGGEHTARIRPHTPAYVSIHQHTSAYGNTRQHTSASRVPPQLPRMSETSRVCLRPSFFVLKIVSSALLPRPARASTRMPTSRRRGSNQELR